MKKPANHGRRAVRLAAALLVLAGGPLAGCGIQETAVIEAGGPVVADLLPPREGRVLLFFFSPDGELLPVPRAVESEWRNSAAVPVGPDDPSAGPDEPYGRHSLGGSPPVGEDESLSPFAAVTALLAGPDKAERRAGLRSAPSLPRTASPVDRIVRDGLTVEVGLRLRVTRLTAPARDQIVCTAAYAAHARGAVSVRLVGQDGRLAPADCPVRPVPVSAR
ncbi:hypothetical protein OHA98_24600 [Streptomyces sp. NBC_00654]|uniref:hypothetical protein n=1 Tax=Streptomyces sp. NBC_00654 TaxID=2975799 RepID=UPI002250C318|nr:hypothetical protein [Streptomyces sp. NBC_00654]MCX4967886.1 hypothetical protein [Streptomyces sp. NBC_00654]